MSRPGGKKRGVKSHPNHSPRKMLDHLCPPIPEGYTQFTTPEFTDDPGVARARWETYLRAVARLTPNPRLTRTTPRIKTR